MLGGALEPVRPVLAAAQQAGEVSADKVAIIADALDKVDRRGFDPADIAAGETLLTEHAAVFPPEDLRLLAARVVDAINPDGTLPHDELNEDRRYLHLKSTQDGAYVGDFRLTGSPARNSRPCSIRWPNRGSTRPEPSMNAPMGNGSMMLWRICATGNSGPGTFPMRAGSRPR